MTAYNFLTRSTPQDGLNYPPPWNDPTEWNTGIVPNSNDADITIETGGRYLSATIAPATHFSYGHLMSQRR